jgi:hypothetical protein
MNLNINIKNIEDINYINKLNENEKEDILNTVISIGIKSLEFLKNNTTEKDNKFKYNSNNFILEDKKITKIIFQTSLVPPREHEIKLINKYFPNYNYFYFNDEDIIKFIKDNPLKEFPYSIKKFNQFTGAHKADFFRYYFLYINGGIFLDSDAMINMDISNILQEYNEIYIESDFFKSRGGILNHIFNGFICTYPKSPVIYNALKHMYECTLIENYQMFCQKLYDILMELNPSNVKIYKEPPEIPNQDISYVYNDKNQKILSHYYQHKIIPIDHDNN